MPVAVHEMNSKSKETLPTITVIKYSDADTMTNCFYETYINTTITPDVVISSGQSFSFRTVAVVNSATLPYCAFSRFPGSPS